MQTGYGKMMKKAEKAEKKQAKGKKPSLRQRKAQLSQAEMRKRAAANAIEKHSK